MGYTWGDFLAAARYGKGGVEGLCMKGLGVGVSESWVNWLIFLFGVVALDEGVLGWLVVVFLF